LTNREDAANAGIAVATAPFGHTFTWGGITSVVDADMGQPITDSLERGLGNRCPGGRQATKRTQGD